MFVFVLVILMLFVGLAIDAGSLYVTFGQLQRAVDAAVIAAANNYKHPEGTTHFVDKNQMKYAALEEIRLHSINIDFEDLKVFICDETGAFDEFGSDIPDGLRDDSLQTTVPEFYSQCPDTPSQAPRKLVWVEAVQKAPIYFLHLIGFNAIPLHTNAIAEAAPVDVVVVIDTSESMGKDTTSPTAFSANPNNYNPDTASGCNPTNTCMPLLDAKVAVKTLVDKLFEGYDQIGVVTFDSQAYTQLNLSSFATEEEKNAIKATIDGIPLHDDPSLTILPPQWADFTLGYRFNPVNPEDRDGDGLDADRTDMYGLPACLPENQWAGSAPWGYILWDTSINPYSWGGVPCDDDDYLDVYDWNGNGIWNDWHLSTPPSDTDHALGVDWLASHDPGGTGQMANFFSPISTCTGCGLRVASNLLKQEGRPDAVWVIIFLSDGVANLSDSPQTAGWVSPAPEASYENGFCQGGLEPLSFTPNGPFHDKFWSDVCIDNQTNPRYCIDSDSGQCPPGSTPVSNPSLKQYSVQDYAMDKVDDAGLTSSSNDQEALGNDIAIYSIRLGNIDAGEYLLRYMADVGDDGDRETRPCLGVTTGEDCGNYYHAPTSSELTTIFGDIAARIFTKITR